MQISPLTRSIVLAIVIHLVFFIPTRFMTPDQQVELWSGGLVVACLWGIWRWGATAWRAFKEGSSEPWHYGILAIVILFIFVIGRQAYQVAYIRYERPSAWLLYPTSAYIIFGTMVAIWLFSLATKLEGEKPSRIMGVITAIGAAIAVFTSSLYPILATKAGAILRFLQGLF